MTEFVLDYTPRAQFFDFHLRQQRWACIVAHRRAGKTVACIADMLDHAFRSTKKNPRFGYIAPTYGQAKKVAWKYLKGFVEGLPGVVIRESDLSVTLPVNKAELVLMGSDNYERHRGIYLDGCIIDEAGDQDPRAYAEVIRPALSDREGWAVFIGTPKGQNEFFRKYKEAIDHPNEWFSMNLKASESGIIKYSELLDMKQTMSKEQYQQELECSFSAGIVGAYYANDIEQIEAVQIRNVPYDRSADVFASMDLGINDTTAIWVGQIVGREYHFLDHYEKSGESLGHYADWLKNLPYQINRLILPHDADARELQTGESRADFLRGRGFKVKVLPRTNDRMGDIDLVRSKFNRFWFDAEKCKRGIDCLRNYKAEYDHKNKVMKRTPLHDWSSNSADAMRYFIMGASDKPKFIEPDRSHRMVRGLV